MRSYNFSSPPKELIDPISKLLARHSFKSLLIACSGGPDSKALLVLLTRISSHLGVSLGVVHIDHGWRKESGEEALALKAFCKELGCPFYLKTLNHNISQTENAARICRQKIFREIAIQHGYEAVVLAHQREDQAETVLKRVFESASLHNLAGMQEKTLLKDIPLIRPWLNVPKQSILNFCKEEKIDYVWDRTNLDKRYLRGRMRSELFPDLENVFGKSIVAPLIKLGKEAFELKQFMEGRYLHYLSKPFYLDLTSLETPFEMRWLISEWLKLYDLNFSAKLVDQLISLIQENKADRRLLLQEATLQVDRKKIFLLSSSRQLLPKAIRLEMGETNLGEWHIVTTPTDTFEEKAGWENSWQGELLATLPEGDYLIGGCQDPKLRIEQKTIAKYWTSQKIPAFLRNYVPIIFSNEKICYDFLSHSSRFRVRNPKKPWIRVLLRNTLSQNHPIDKIK